jgi:hypothetical protein
MVHFAYTFYLDVSSAIQLEKMTILFYLHTDKNSVYCSDITLVKNITCSASTLVRILEVMISNDLPGNYFLYEVVSANLKKIVYPECTGLCGQRSTEF